MNSQDVFIYIKKCLSDKINKLYDERKGQVLKEFDDYLEKKRFKVVSDLMERFNIEFNSDPKSPFWKISFQYIEKEE